MRILICTGIFPPEIGGPATYSKTLAEAFTKRGHEVRVITYFTATSSPPIPLRGTGGEREGVVRISRSWFKPWHYFKYFLAAKKYGKNADLIYAQDPVSAGYPSSLAARILKKPFAIKITGDYSWEQAMGRGLTDKLIDEFQTLKNLPPKIGRIRGTQIRVCQEAKLIITPSEYLKKIVAGWGIAKEKIKVIYNSAHVPDLPVPKKNTKEFLVVSSGRNVPWKGFEVLREAVTALSNSMELDTRLIKLEILQNMPREKMLSRLASADLFALNTGYEGFAHSVVEAMAVGVPVVTTNVCGNPEVIQDGYNGLLVEYNNAEQLKNAILKLYKDEELRQKFIQNGKATLEKFSLKNLIFETERALLSCVS